MRKLFSAAATLGAIAMIAGTVAPVSATYNHNDGDQCNEETTYTKSSDYSNSKVTINFENSDSQIDVSAGSGYAVVKVELDVENDGHSGFYTYATGPVDNFNPNPGNDIDEARVTVKKVCVTPTATPTPSVVVTPTPTPVDENPCNQELRVAYVENENEVDPCVTPTATPEPTQPPQNPGGPGDGKSDGRSDGRSSCPECTKAPTGDVLGASTDFAPTGTAVDMLMNAVGSIGALSTVAGLVLVAKKRNI
jgi:hypothetical protein